jgi:hypothetical protein
LKRTAFAESQVYSVKGDARLTIEAPQGKGTVSLFAAALHPSFVHLEQLDFFGKPQGILTTDGAQFGLYQAAENTFYKGPATPANLSRFLPLVIPAPELTGLLLGRIPRIDFDLSDMKFDEKTQLFILKLTKNANANRGVVTQTLHISPPSYRVVHSEIVGVSAYDVEASEMETMNGQLFAKSIILKAKARSTTLEINWKGIELNGSADLTLFDLSAPEEVPLVELDEQGIQRAPP